MLFAGAKTPLQLCSWLKKYTFKPLLFVLKRHTAAALLTCRKVHAGLSFPLFRLAASLFNNY